MGFWSALGNIGKAAVGFVPGIGQGIQGLLGGGDGEDSEQSNLSKILGIAGGVAPVLGGMAAGRQQGLMNEDLSSQSRDRNALQRAALANQYGLTSTQMGNANAQQGYENQMSQAKYRMDAPSIRAEQARKGDLLANVQDVSVSHPRAAIAHFTGGLRPSALGPNAREAGRLLSSGAVDAMRSGEQLPTSPEFSAAPPPMIPNLSTAPQSGILDKILSVAAPASALAGAVQPYFNRQNPFFERNQANAGRVPPPGRASQIPEEQPPYQDPMQFGGNSRWRMF